MKIEIKHRYTDSVIWTCEDAIDFRDALQKAAVLKVNLSGSDLSGSDLSGSDLSYSDLSYSDLSGSDLSYSNLSGSNLRGSDLSGSNYGDSKIKSILQTGPIGSRKDYSVCYNTDNGLIVHVGCFRDTMEKFKEAVEKTHGESKHGRDYRAWINLCEEWSKE